MNDNYLTNQYSTGSAVLETPGSNYMGPEVPDAGWKKGGAAQTASAGELRPAGAVKMVCVCDTQPVTAEGIRILLQGHRDLAFSESTESLQRGLDLVRRQAPDVLLIDKAFGIQAILDWLQEMRLGDPGTRTAVVSLGVSITGRLRRSRIPAMRSFRGILRKHGSGYRSASFSLRTVSEGREVLDGKIPCSAIRRAPDQLPPQRN